MTQMEHQRVKMTKESTHHRVESEMNRKIAILEGHLNRARMEMQANVDELVRIAKGNSWNAHTKSQTELEHRIRDAKIMITKLTGQIMIAKSNSRKQYFTSEGKAKLDAAERHYKYLLEQEKYRTPIVHRVPVPTVIVEAKPSGGHWEEVVTRKYVSDGDSTSTSTSTIKDDYLNGSIMANSRMNTTVITKPAVSSYDEWLAAQTNLSEYKETTHTDYGNITADQVAKATEEAMRAVHATNEGFGKI